MIPGLTHISMFQGYFEGNVSLNSAVKLLYVTIEAQTTQQTIEHVSSASQIDL